MLQITGEEIKMLVGTITSMPSSSLSMVAIL